MRLQLFLIAILILAMPCMGSLRADLNGDRRVDFADLSILASEWMCEEPMGDYVFKTSNGNQRVVVADNASIQLSASNGFSVSSWVNIETISENGDVSVAYKTNPILGGWSLTILPSEILFSVTSPSGGISNVSAVFNRQQVGLWINLICVYKNGVVNRLYVNAIPHDGSNVNHDTISTIGTDMVFGETNSAISLFDDIRIYKDKILSEEEAAYIYNNGQGRKIIGTEEGLSWGCNFDTGSGNTFYDALGVTNGFFENNIEDNMWEAGGVPFQLNSAVGWAGWPYYYKAVALAREDKKKTKTGF